MCQGVDGRNSSGSLAMLGRDPSPPSRRASEAERRERLGLWVGDISLMPNGTLDGFNHILDFDEGLTDVFRVSAILFLRQSSRDVAAVRTSLSRAAIRF